MIKFSAMKKEKLKKTRLEWKLSQKGFGDLLGVDQATISRMESGAVKVPKWVDKMIYYIEKLLETESA